MVVVLPAPFGPRKATISPCWSSRSMPRTAWTSPKALVTPESETAGTLVVAPVLESWVCVMAPACDAGASRPYGGRHDRGMTFVSRDPSGVSRQAPGRLPQPPSRGFETGARAPSSTTVPSVAEEVAQQPSRSRVSRGWDSIHARPALVERVPRLRGFETGARAPSSTTVPRVSRQAPGRLPQPPSRGFRDRRQGAFLNHRPVGG